MTIRIPIADDHPVVLTGLRALLGTEPDMIVVAEASKGEAVVALHAAHQPDATLMDLRMPKSNGVAATAEILRYTPGARVVASTTSEGDADIHRALEPGPHPVLFELADPTRGVLASQTRSSPCAA